MARLNPRSHFVTWYATSGTKYVKVASLLRMTRSLSSPKSVVRSQSAPSLS